MKKPEFVEVLDIHAEGLKAGIDLAPVLASEDQPLKSLLSVAAQVKSALVPVEPRPGFVTDLRARLLTKASKAQTANAIRRGEQERKVILGAVAGAGGVLYAAGLALLGL